MSGQYSLRLPATTKPPDAAFGNTPASTGNYPYLSFSYPYLSFSAFQTSAVLGIAASAETIKANRTKTTVPRKKPQKPVGGPTFTGFPISR